MDTPQEPPSSRIVPFPQRERQRDSRPGEPTPEQLHGASGELIPRQAADGDTAGTAGSSADETIDRLLEISTIHDSLHGGSGRISHVRAVQLGVSSGAFYPHTATENVPFAAARLGIGSVELMLQTASEYDPAFITQVAANARSAGVTVHSVHSMSGLHPMTDSYRRRADEARALFQRGIEATAALDAQVLVWHGPLRKDVSTDAGWEHFIALTRDLAEACGAAGITLAIENVSRCALAQVRHVVNFATRLSEIGTQREIGFVFDPFQAAEAGANPFMMLAAMGNRIVNVHISDYLPSDPSERHLLPGDGTLPWSALLRAVAGSGYVGPLMIEGPLGTDDQGIARVRKTINPLIRSVFPFSPDANRIDAPLSPADDGSGAVTLVAPPPGVLKGIDLFNQRHFYEQHEEIEHEWHAERGPIRRLYQGILQIGVGFHHAINRNYRGAVALLTDGIEKTSDFRPEALGIATGKLTRESAACLEQILALGPDQIAEFDPGMIPRIELIAR